MNQLAAAAAAVIAALSSPAVASPAGEWRIADGTANVAIRSCGANFCGFVSWAKDSDMIGKPVLISMKPNGDVWAGSIVNARDGQKYVGRMSLRGEQVLKVEGCVLGGMICGGQQWSRLK
ncbi:DUF2147 domain-containing protein [Methylocella silvestris]|uniref:DUF2147 domain-containing protein n=1 Tax=Methylocella silvestris TaxID=199596 RepID=A0A2J7TIX5_METSI|nr:DUF2147 domain-containing protein [Methylocella silvestris]PNG26724.1 hypothetical protein CR492_06965 [Methylocella silvestris]